MAVSKSRLTWAGWCLAIVFSLAADTLEAGQVELLSRANPLSDTASGPSSIAITEAPAVSADGRYIAFTSPAVNLVPSQFDINDSLDVFLHDRETGNTLLVSRAAGQSTRTGSGASYHPSISADGRYVAFVSTAYNLAFNELDTYSSKDVFLFDRASGIVTKVTHWETAVPAPDPPDSYDPVISGDGNWVAFVSSRTDLVAGQNDGNGAQDVFLYDRAGDTTLLVSRAAGTTATAGDEFSESPTLSADGRYLASTAAPAT